MIFKKRNKKVPTSTSNPPFKLPPSNQTRYLTDELEGVLSGWLTGDVDIDSTISKYQKKMVHRAREQHRKNDYVRRYFQLLKTNVIGDQGITMHALLEDDNGERLHKQNKELEKAWQRWQRKDFCDITNQLDFVQMQQLILTTVAQDGEAIIKIVCDPKNPFGMSLQLIDAQHIDVEYNKKLSNGRMIKHGVEFEATGKPIAYHFLECDALNNITSTKKYNRVLAINILHIFKSEQIGQKRGMPWVATALFRMKMLDSYQDAAIINANATAKKIAFFKKTFNDTSDDVETPQFQDEHIGYGIIPPGYELVPFDSQYPNGESEPFTKSILRGIASGLGVSYNSLATDLEGVNFSSLRHGAIEERDSYKVMQGWFVSAFLKPLYERWLESALLSNAINSFSINDFNFCLDVRFQPRRWQWVDPTKEITALEKKLNIGVTTRTDIIREMGLDADEVFNQLKHEQDFFEKEGLTYLLHPAVNKEQQNNDNLAKPQT